MVRREDVDRKKGGLATRVLALLGCVHRGRRWGRLYSSGEDVWFTFNAHRVEFESITV